MRKHYDFKRTTHSLNGFKKSIVLSKQTSIRSMGLDTFIVILEILSTP